MNTMSPSPMIPTRIVSTIQSLSLRLSEKTYPPERNKA
jgi:hypothetical protein